MPRQGVSSWLKATEMGNLLGSVKGLMKQKKWYLPFFSVNWPRQTSLFSIIIKKYEGLRSYPTCKLIGCCAIVS